MWKHDARRAESKSRYYKQRNVQSKKRQAICRWFVSIRHGRHVLSQCPKQKHFPPVLVPFFNISGGWLPLFRALAKNMAPMTNADESPTNRLTLFPIYLSLFIVSTLWWSVFTQFRVFPIFTSVDITVYQYGKNVLYSFYNIAQRTLTEEWREIFRVDIELYQHGS